MDILKMFCTGWLSSYGWALLLWLGSLSQLEWVVKLKCIHSATATIQYSQLLISDTHANEIKERIDVNSDGDQPTRAYLTH